MSQVAGTASPKNKLISVVKREMNSTLYIAVDGDDVGRRLEFYTVNNQIKELSIFFQNYQKSMVWMGEILSQKFDAKIIINGGDSLLAVCNQNKQLVRNLEILRKEFSLKVEATLSIGIGADPRQAYLALKLAKASGKNRIEIFGEV